MHLLLIRHAQAVARGTPGIAEDARPLTAKGERRFRKAARGLTRLLDAPDVLLTSPLPRARRTAEIAARCWGGGLEPADVPALITAREPDVRRLLAEHRAAALVAMVGHEPSLSTLAARLLGAADGSAFAFKKGSALLLELETPRARARLRWALPPRVSRALAPT